MYVCVCHAVTEHEIEAAIEQGACSLELLRERLHVSTCCGACREVTELILGQKTAERNVAVETS